MTMQITTGFLTGNLFGDENEVDVAASAERYADAIAEAISAAYPEADVQVRYEDATGSLPDGLQTHVTCDGEDEDTLAELEEIAEHVGRIHAEVYEDAESWIVDRTPGLV